EVAVAVEVGRREVVSVGRGAYLEGPSHLKSPIPPAEQYLHVVAACTPVRDCQVEVAVLVEVARRESPNLRSATHEGLDLILEGAVPAAEQAGNIPGGGVGRGQVEDAVAIEVAGQQPARRGPGGVSAGVLKRPIPAAEKNRHIAGDPGGNGQ